MILMTAGKIIYFLLPLPVALFTLSLMSMHMKYYDIGVNPGANNGFLYFFVFPVLLISLYIIAAGALFLANRFLKAQWQGILIGILLLIITGIGSFMVYDHLHADYPSEKPKNMRLFLHHYFSK